jgi:putative peptidoglycan lipid II flippase
MLARAVTTVGAATLLSRLLGFFRDVGIAAVLGAGVLSDAYFAALQVPNLFRRLLAEGALNSAFVPIWLRLRNDDAGGARRFGEEVLGLLGLSLAVIAALCIVFAPTVVHLLAPGFEPEGARFALAVTFTRLSVFYIVIAGTVAVAAAMLNAQARVGAAALSPVIFNCVLFAALVVVLLLGAGASATAGAVLAGAVVLAGVAQLMLVGAALWRTAEHPRRLSFFLSADARDFFARAVPGVVAGGIPQLKLIVGAIVVSSSPAAVSWLNYAIRLYELPLGMISIGVASVIVPAIAAGVRTGERERIAAAQSRALELALGVALPAAAAFALLAVPIVGGLFQRGAFGAHDTAMVAAALLAMSVGLPGHVLEKVFGAVSFAHEDTRTPMIAALCGLAAAVVGSLLLFPRFGHVGVAAAITASGWIGATLLGLVLKRHGWIEVDDMARRRLPRIVLATVIMALVIGGAHELLPSTVNATSTAVARLVTLAMLVAVGLAGYLAAVEVLGVARIGELRAAIRGKP